ncbi:MAG: hypothetical protein AABX37_02895 [Nanoarchaeota archaeon]
MKYELKWEKLMTTTIDSFIESVEALLEQAGVEDETRREEYGHAMAGQLQQKIAVNRKNQDLFVQRRNQGNRFQEQVDMTLEHQEAYKRHIVQMLTDYVVTIRRNVETVRRNEQMSTAYKKPGMTKKKIEDIIRKAVHETCPGVKESYRL